MAEDEKTTTDHPPLDVPSSDRFVFTNIFSMAFGDNDVILNFAIDDRAGGGRRISPQASVCMTPRSAKILAHTLAATIKRFEEANGPISMPAGKLEKLQESIDAQRQKSKKQET